MLEFAQGDLVIVRAAGDKALLRRVWAQDDGLVLIHDEGEYTKHLSGADCLLPVAFPLQDAFSADAQTLDLLNRAGGSLPWTEVEPFVSLG